jgi:L-ascorbate metabolism protein UlaG (beta-lactamase superfamily)
MARARKYRLRNVLYLLIATLLVLFAVANIVGRRLNAPGYSGAPSDHFDGTEFRNREDVELPSVTKGIRYLFTTRPGPWDDWRDNPNAPRPPERVGPHQLRVTFVNHATTLIQLDGINVLTDPTWAERASPFSFLGPRRRHAAGLPFEELPPIDIVLVSHNHYDHLNLPTLARLQADHDPEFVVGLGNRALLEKHGIERVRELDWNESAQLKSLSIIAQPARHFSGRGISDRQRNLWVSFVIDGPGGRVYFAGDTSYGSHFAATARELGPLRLAILPIGAYEPRWFMAPVHLNPAEAVQAHVDLGAHRSLAMHYGTFRLSEEGQDKPVEDLRRAFETTNVNEDDFWILAPGQGRDVPPRKD